MELESSLRISGLTDPLLTGSISAPTVNEEGGVAPSNIIRTDQKWDVKIDWSLEGSLLRSPFFHFVGEWIVRVYLESMGPSREYVLPKRVVGVTDFEWDPVEKSKRNYTTTIVYDPTEPSNFAPNDPEKLDEPLGAGIYKMVVAVTYEYIENKQNKPGPIAGFHEGVLLQLYDAE